MTWGRGCKLQGNLLCSHLLCIYLPLALVGFSRINYITYYIISLITDKVFKNNAFRKLRGKCKNRVRLLEVEIWPSLAIKIDNDKAEFK